jgi:hypothetical protein
MKSRCELLRCLAPLVLWTSGCGEELQPCFELRLNEPLELRVVSEYSAAAGYDFGLGAQVNIAACPAALKLSAPRSLQLAVVAHEETDTLPCRPNTVEVSAGSGLALGARAPRVSFGSEDDAEIVHATQELTLEGCGGHWGLSVESRASSGAQGDAFVPAPGSGYPPIVMHAGFQVEDRGSAACRQLLGEALFCADYYVVELARP